MSDRPAFRCAGYRRRRYWWESVAILRKFLIVAITTQLDADSGHQIYAGLYVRSASSLQCLGMLAPSPPHILTPTAMAVSIDRYRWVLLLSLFLHNFFRPFHDPLQVCVRACAPLVRVCMHTHLV